MWEERLPLKTEAKVLNISAFLISVATDSSGDQSYLGNTFHSTKNKISDAMENYKHWIFLLIEFIWFRRLFPAFLYSWEERVKMWRFGGEEGIVSLKVTL